MDHISRRVRHIWAAVAVGFLSTLVIPAAAWAEQSGVADVLRRKPSKGIGFGGILGLLCCVVVVGGIALVVYLVIKNQRKK
jgi:hypothetical protein